MTPIISSLSPLFEFQLPRNISGTDFGTGYGGTVCGFHTRPSSSPLIQGLGMGIHIHKAPVSRFKEFNVEELSYY